MLETKICLLKFFFIILLINSIKANDYFNEELFIETLPNSNLNLLFQFTTISDQNLNDESSFNHYDLFPKQIGEIIKKFQINELHLTQTQGLWKYNIWGEPLIANVAPGVELNILYNDLTEKNSVDTLWQQTTRSLAGLFCSSLNFMNNQTSIEPKFSIKPTGHILYSRNNVEKSLDKRLKYSTLPSEIVCTENITPWIKLLPCGKYNGLAQLLTNPSKIFDTTYNSIGIHFRHICLDGSKCEKIGVELKQTLSLVIDNELHLKQKFVNDQTRWSFSSIFSSTISSTCPVAKKSLIYFDLNLLQNNENLSVEPKPSEIISSQNIFTTERNLFLFDLKKIFETKSTTLFDLTVRYDKSGVLNNNKRRISLVKVHRYVTGTNQFNLGLKTVFENTYQSNDVIITYLENIPWYFKVYLHTMKINYENTNELIKPKLIHYIPALDRERPHQIEIKFLIKANSVVNLNIKFENAFLKWNEFPPDANHGHSINPAVVIYDQLVLEDEKSNNLIQYRGHQNYSLIYDSIQASQEKERQIRIYTETLLVNLPAPDFSMPYNVICLTCTVIAIGFGSLHNFTTRKFAFKETKSLKKRIKEFFNRFIKSKPSNVSLEKAPKDTAEVNTETAENDKKDK